jgi:hypothetical protein
VHGICRLYACFLTGLCIVVRFTLAMLMLPVHGNGLLISTKPSRLARLLVHELWGRRSQAPHMKKTGQYGPVSGITWVHPSRTHYSDGTLYQITHVKPGPETRTG